MEPEPGRWSFRFGEALPASDARARFVVSIGAALNDLIFLNRLYVRDPAWGLLRRDPTKAESIYLMRLVASAVFELGRLIDKGRQDPGIAGLLDALDDSARRDLDAVVGAGPVRATLRRVRDSTSHYPWPDDASLSHNLDRLANEIGEFEAHPSSMASIRATFADQVLLQPWIAKADEDLTSEEVEQRLRFFVGRLRDLVLAGIRLGQHVLVAHFGELPIGVLDFQPARRSFLGAIRRWTRDVRVSLRRRRDRST